MRHRSRRVLTMAVTLLLALGGATGPSAALDEFRTIDGSGNNPDQPELGMAGTALVRITTLDYEDLISAPAGAGRPSARLVSNAICAQSASLPNSVGFTDFVWQWGQFVDHDIDLTTSADPPEPFNIPVPFGDPFFDPDSTGTQVIPLERSIHEQAGPPDPRQQINEITAFIDASNVYGSDEVRAAALRTNDGTGRLKTGHFGLDDPETAHDDYLPFNTDGLPNAGGPGPGLFLAGDVRANEQVALTAMHTLFVREHNRLATEIAAADGSLSGDAIYEQARAIVGAQMQVITYKEFLPVLIGFEALDPYAGYSAEVDPGIANSFSTAAYRVGHSMLSPTLLRTDANGDPVAAGHLPLKDAFFAPQELDPAVAGGIAPLLRGLGEQVAQEIDVQVIDAVRNFLFGLPGQGGFDLASLNLQRGRDHGLCDYNQARVDLGLDAVVSFAEITSDPALQQQLETLYGSVDDIDMWGGGLAEDHVPGARLGELFFTAIQRQFEVLRDGDRFWYQRIFSGAQLEDLEQTKLSDIIRRNTEIGTEIDEYVFGDPCASWAALREVVNVVAYRGNQSGAAVFRWKAPQDLDGTPFALSYEAIRSEDPADFIGAAECLPFADPTQTSVVDEAIPPTSRVYYYLARARNSCPEPGTLGSDSAGQQRSGLDCR